MAANSRPMHTGAGASSEAGQARGRRRMSRGLFIMLLALMGDTAVVWAQAHPAQMAAVSAAAPAEAVTVGTEAGGIRSVQLLVGHSTVIETGEAISRVSLTSADVADAMVTAPQQLLVHGKTPGTISMFVWARGGAIQRYEVVVQRDLDGLNNQVRQLFPGEKITAASNGRALVLSGHVSTKDVATKAVDVASGYVDKKDDVVNLLQVGDAAIGNQVLLRVRFAEVSRNAMQSLGASLYTDGYQNTVGRIGTDQYAQPSSFNQKNPMLGNSQVFSDFLNLFLFDAKHQLGAVIKALQSKGLMQSLAEPNLVAESGKEASFLAGGEFPIPVAQGSGANLAISVMFKEFGVRLNFTPTVNGNRVHLKVRPEVSTLDFNNAVILQGFKIPALSTRRTETELELQDGQTFAIAGLMNSSVMSTLQKVPGIGDIPILGQLFRSKQAQKDHTELVVIITPEILSRTSPGVTDQLPRMPESFLAPLPDKKTVEPPPPAFRGPRPSASTAAPAAAPASTGTDAAGSPASAAAAVAARSPKGPTPFKPAELNTPPARATAASNASVSPTAAPDTAVASADANTAAAMNVAPATAAPVARALNADEKKLLERMQKEQDKKEQAAKAAEAKRQAQEAEEQAKAEKKAQELQARAAKEQAKRDAEAAKKQAETEKKQAAAELERQKKLDEAAAKVKAAQTAYDAELSKASKNQ